MKIIISKYQYNLLIENNSEKNKKFLIDILGHDFISKIKEIKNGSDIPKMFHRYLDLNGVKGQIDMVGPMYYFTLDGKGYLYQDQSKFYYSHDGASFGEMFMSEDGKRDYSNKILEELGIYEMGLKFTDVINMFNKEKN
jgi:hypothetical protein